MDALLVPIHDFTCDVDHTVEFDDLDRKLEARDCLLADLGVGQLCWVVEEKLCVLWFAFLSLFIHTLVRFSLMCPEKYS